MSHVRLRRILSRSRDARNNLASARSLCVEMLEERTLMTLQGNSLFPADNPWNQPITAAPVAANSATLVSRIGGGGLHPDFRTVYQGANIGIPYNVVPGNQPKINVVVDAYAGESDLLRVPIPSGAVIEGDPLPAAQNTGDRHLIVYDKDNNIAYELFNVHRPGEIDGQWHADSEAVWDMSQDSFRTPGDTSADAAGLPILPGLVRVDEVLDQGVINHALRFTVPRTTGAYVYPASHVAGNSDSTYPRMGERFRLKASFDISGFSAADKVILQALKDYGMIVADNGSGWFLSGAPSSRWNDDDLHALGSVLGSNFEAVNLTPVASSLDQASGTSAGGTAVTIHGQNFSGAAGQLQVLFGNTPASHIQIVSDTVLVATSPASSQGTVPVTVKTPYGTSTVTASDQFTFTSGAAIAESHLFYNNSAFDGNTSGVSTSDDLAVATDKTPYFAGGGLAASSALSTYSRGINGIMIDLVGSGSHASINAGDFVFKTGNDNTPSGWSTAPQPSAISVRTGAGVGGSDRVEILWGANAVTNAWLEVQFLSTANTGLAATDVFFWGNRIGDANLNFSTNSGDGTITIASVAAGVPITSPSDFNRNGAVNSGDGTRVLSNTGILTRINISAGAFAPSAGGDGADTASPQASPLGDGGLSSALANISPSSSGDIPGSSSRLPAWLADRVLMLDSNNLASDEYYRRLSLQTAHRGRAELGNSHLPGEPPDAAGALLDVLLTDLGLE